jgi:arabinoxylan arabinofuranohydrolase
MVKHGGRYHLMYSSGKTIEDSYQVHHAVGDSPFGPFEEPAASPCLATDAANHILSPGHHAVFERDGRHYILYHRHSIPFDPAFIGRQICVDELRFGADGLIAKVIPTHAGPTWIRRPAAGGAAVGFTASGQRAAHTAAGRAGDNNHATLWAAGAAENEAWIQMDLGRQQAVAGQDIRFEYPWKTYRFLAEASPDGRRWRTLADHRVDGLSGSPVVIDIPAEARFLRLVFPNLGPNTRPGLFEWRAW